MWHHLLHYPIIKRSVFAHDQVKKMAYVSSPSKSLVLRAKNAHVARKLKKMAYVSLSVNVTIINPIKVADFESKERLRS